MQQLVMELTEQQTMILKAAAMRALDAKAKYDVADRAYNEMVAIITPPGSVFDPMRGVFFREVEDPQLELVEGECGCDTEPCPLEEGDES